MFRKSAKVHPRSEDIKKFRDEQLIMERELNKLVKNLDKEITKKSKEKK